MIAFGVHETAKKLVLPVLLKIEKELLQTDVSRAPRTAFFAADEPEMYRATVGEGRGRWRRLSRDGGASGQHRCHRGGYFNIANHKKLLKFVEIRGILIQTFNLRRATPVKPNRPLPKSHTAAGSGTGGGLPPLEAIVKPEAESEAVPSRV